MTLNILNKRNRCTKLLTLICILFILGMSTVPALVYSSSTSSKSRSSDAVKELTIYIEDEQPQMNKYGQKILVAGIWHRVDITLNTTCTEINITLTYGNPSEHNLNIANYYEWSYNKTQTAWYDLQYNNTYIQTSKCNLKEQTYSFYIGTDAHVLYGSWDINIKLDGTEVYSESIAVEEPKTGLGQSAGSFILPVTPYKRSKTASKDLNQHLTLMNEGNVPLAMSITYDRYEDRITITPPCTLLHVGESIKHHITFDADAWAPRKIVINVEVEGETMLMIPSTTGMAITGNVKLPFDITIYVGHAGLELAEMDDITFQYKKKHYAEYKEPITFDAYLTGTLAATLDVSVENVKLIGVIYKGKTAKLPISFHLTNTSEEHIIVQVETDQDATTAYIHYTIRSVDGAINRTLTSELVVKPKPEVKPSETTDSGNAESDDGSWFDLSSTGDKRAIIFFIIIVVAVVLVFMALYKPPIMKELEDVTETDDKKRTKSKSRRFGSRGSRRKR